MATTLTSTGVLYNDGTTITNSVTATRAIFGYGRQVGPTSIINLVNNYGAVSTVNTPVNAGREFLAAAGYGGDKAIFGYGSLTTIAGPTFLSMTNLVSNLGVVGSDVIGVGQSRDQLAAAGYGGDKAIFGYGSTFANYDLTNLVSNLGVVATDTSGVGGARHRLAAASYSS